MRYNKEQVEQLIRKNVGLAEQFDFSVSSVSENSAELRVPFAENMTRLGGTISGPVMMTAADTAMYAAVIMASDNGEFGVTSHLNIEFLSRPPTAALRVVARVLRAGKRQVSCVVEISSEADDRLVAHVTGAYILFEQPSKSENI